jgi:hypothetical protein
MNKISVKSVLDIVRASVDDKDIAIDLNSSSLNIRTWDSLMQINILVALDDKLEGKAAEIDELSTAASVEQILNILKLNDLLED